MYPLHRRPLGIKQLHTASHHPTATECPPHGGPEKHGGPPRAWPPSLPKPGNTAQLFKSWVIIMPV
jgi:hypothetical protein